MDIRGRLLVITACIAVAAALGATPARAQGAEPAEPAATPREQAAALADAGKPMEAAELLLAAASESGDPDGSLRMDGGHQLLAADAFDRAAKELRAVSTEAGAPFERRLRARTVAEAIFWIRAFEAVLAAANEAQSELSGAGGGLGERVARLEPRARRAGGDFHEVAETVAHAWRTLADLAGDDDPTVQQLGELMREFELRRPTAGGLAAGVEQASADSDQMKRLASRLDKAASKLAQALDGARGDLRAAGDHHAKAASAFGQLTGKTAKVAQETAETAHQLAGILRRLGPVLTLLESQVDELETIISTGRLVLNAE